MPAPPLANTLEGGTDTVTISAANSGGASGDAFTAVTGAAVYRSAQTRDTLSMGVTQAGTSSPAYCWWQTLGSITTDLYYRYYFWRSSATLVFSDIGIFVAITGAAAVSVYGNMNASGFLGARNAANADIAASRGSVQIAANQWVRIEYRIKSSATVGEVEWRLFNTADSTVADDTKVVTGLVLGANTDQLRFGNLQNMPVSTSWYYDDFAVSTAGWIGPSFVAPPITNAPETLHVAHSGIRMR